MALYKYTSNKSVLDNTEEIRLEGREPVRQGGEVELSDEEHDALKGTLNLRKVDESDSKEGVEGSKEETREGRLLLGNPTQNEESRKEVK